MEEQAYKVYKGLQKPNVMFGLKGQNITLGLATVLGALVTVLASYFIGLGMMYGLGLSLIPLGIGAYKIKYKMDHGLYNKRKHKGVVITRMLMSRL